MLRVDVNFTFQEKKTFYLRWNMIYDFRMKSGSKVGINNIPGNRDPGEKE